MSRVLAVLKLARAESTWCPPASGLRREESSGGSLTGRHAFPNLAMVRMTAATTGLLILVRHGESDWNRSNRFTGWKDVALTAKGFEDARRAGKLIRDNAMRVDLCYTSGLTRAMDSAVAACDVLQGTSSPFPAGSQRKIPIERRHRLNERHYGGLTGLNKRDVKQVLPKSELLEWRTTLDGRPPPLDVTNPLHGEIADWCDADALAREGLELPLTESLRDCCARVEPLWRDELRPAVIEEGQTVMVVGHANNLRALIRCIQGLDDDELARLGVPNGLPLVYEFLSSGQPLPAPQAVGTVPPLTGRYLGLDAVWFEELDLDRSGTLDADELAQAGLCGLDDGTCNTLLESIDNNGDGQVDFNEFVSWLNRSID